MSYLESGFDQFLTQSQPNPLGSTPIDQASLSSALTLSANQFANPTSANTIQGGIMKSQNGKMIIDLVNGRIKISDGTQDRVTLGLLSDNSIGLEIKDQDGNILMDISGTNNLIQSADGAFEINLLDEQILIFNQGVPQILLGKQVGGF